MKRRDFMRTAGGASAAVTASAVAAGPAAAQEERPDFEGYLDGVDGGYEDLRGQDEVTVMVGASGNGGNLAFSPAGIWIDEGTTVTWEWTGEGGAHNVVADAQDTPFDNDHPDLDSGSAVEEAGYTYEYTFEEGGRTGYVCAPHRAVDMYGAIAVGDDVPIIEPGGDTGWPEDVGQWGVPLHAHWVGVASALGIALTFVFTFYLLKYGESAHTGHGDS